MRSSNSRHLTDPSSEAKHASVRTFRESDLLQIEEFFAATGVFNEDELVCLHDDMSSFARGEYEGDQVWVFDAGQGPQGLIHYGPLPISEHGFGLHWIGVDPNCQAKGVGTLLVRTMEKDVMENGGRIIFIETSSRDDYTNTRNFYLKHGYGLAARIADYYAPKDDKCIFSKTLKAT